MISLNVNGKPQTTEDDPNTPLLWYLRDRLGLTGTKFGCGIGECGACTVLVNGRARRACLAPIRAMDGRSVTTIEGLSANGLHAVQKAWLEEDVAQCGYCQVGQIMNAVDLLMRHPDPSDEEIDRLQTNLCRCGTYFRIRKAIHLAAQLAREEG